MRQPVHVAVADLAATAPRAVAVLHGKERVSYAVLNAAADAYARLFSSWGVSKGHVVSLMLPRSASLVAVQLGVLKCGAAYTGIDHRWPPGRVASIVRQLGPTIVVGQEGATRPQAAGRFVEAAPLAEVARGGREFPGPSVSLDDPATIFFTSGTTGVSKGVVTTHRALTRLFGPDGLPGFGAGHVTPQAAPVPWDMYAFEVWGQLTTGGTIAIVEEDYLMPRRLRGLVAADGVDTVWLTTSLFNLFVDEDIDSFSGVVELYVGGEKQSPDHVRSFLRRHPAMRVWNGYGPAENCMLSTVQPMTVDDCAVPEGIPVGRPVPGGQVVVLREDGTTASTAEVGEICVAGEGLAVGYLNDDGLSRERFVEIRLEGEPVRVYRTGDLGLLDDSGVLHYRGRHDRQVKISGNRVELGEIESAARQVPGVRNCAAVAIRAPDGYVERIALFYTVNATDTAPTSRELRKQLAEALPPYAVPATLEKVDALPVTHNGKLDVRALTEGHAP